MTQLKLFLFGLPRLARDEEPLNFRRRKALALLAYLAVKRQPHSRDALCAHLWPEFDRVSAQNNLRRELSLLKSQLGEDVLVADRTQVTFDPNGIVWVDVNEFGAYLATANTHMQHSEQPDSDDIVALSQAIDIYSEDFLAGFSLPDSVAFDEWQFFEAESLRRAFGEAVQTLIQCYVDLGAYDMSIEPCRRWLALDPLYEPAQRRLMEVLAWAEQHTVALRQYKQYVHLLDEELGVPPEEQTTALFEAIHARQLSPPESMPRHVSDLSRPLHNLPAQVTPFIGRQQELAHVDALLADFDVRLITILAAGGMGKTRLVLAAAEHQIDDYANGVYFVDLAPLSDAKNIVLAIAEALRYDPPPDERNLKEQLLDHLHEKQMLLLLDNFEHLLDDVGVVHEILHAAPQVKLLATSREKLNISGETVFSIEGLDFPTGQTSDDILDYSAGQLFVQGAKRAQSSFALHPENTTYVAQICQMVQGLPLGILLAASWVGTLSTREIVDEMQQGIAFLETQMQDIPERHHSIRAVFSSSWQMLSPAAREILMQLSVFRGGFTREAIQKVTGATLRDLTNLINKAMLSHNPESGRYGIHELLRQYTEDHLIASGKIEEANDAHSLYYLNLLASLESDLKGRRQVAGLDQIEADLDNIRAAWQYAALQSNFAAIGRALDSVVHFFDMRSRFREGEAILRLAIDQLGTFSDLEHQFQVSRIQSRRIKFLRNGRLVHSEDVHTLINDCLAMAQSRHNHMEIGWCMGELGRIMSDYDIGTPSEREATLNEGLTHFRLLNDPFHIANMLDGIGVIQCGTGKIEIGLKNLQ